MFVRTRIILLGAHFVSAAALPGSSMQLALSPSQTGRQGFPDKNELTAVLH